VATALSQLSQVLPLLDLHIARSVVAQLGLFSKQSTRVAPAATLFTDHVSSTSEDPVSAPFSIDFPERTKMKVFILEVSPS